MQSLIDSIQSYPQIYPQLSQIVTNTRKRRLSDWATSPPSERILRESMSMSAPKLDADGFDFATGGTLTPSGLSSATDISFTVEAADAAGGDVLWIGPTR